MFNLGKKNFLKITFLVSLFALIFAYFIEYVLGHQPCNLCLIERIPYLLALIIIIINYKFNHLEKYLILLLIFVFLTGTLISLYHLGIEQGFIEESPLCDLKNSSKILSKEAILKQATTPELRAIAVKEGFQTMQDMGRRLIAAGELNFREYERVLSNE